MKLTRQRLFALLEGACTGLAVAIVWTTVARGRHAAWWEVAVLGGVTLRHLFPRPERLVVRHVAHTPEQLREAVAAVLSRDTNRCHCVSCMTHALRAMTLHAAEDAHTFVQPGGSA